MNIKKWFDENVLVILILLMFIAGIVSGSIFMSCFYKSKMVIITDPVTVYQDGTTMVINEEGIFSYKNAVGIISQEQLLKKIGVDNGL